MLMQPSLNLAGQLGTWLDRRDKWSQILCSLVSFGCIQIYTRYFCDINLNHCRRDSGLEQELQILQMPLLPRFAPSHLDPDPDQFGPYFTSYSVTEKESYFHARVFLEIVCPIKYHVQSLIPLKCLKTEHSILMLNNICSQNIQYAKQFSLMLVCTF